ncbi:Group XIIA secretory phospholipase A2 [Camponotus floridanus]|uniref:Group XIIA secretory phospholipase A2 n=1 Tax=Camponotus floridanus TaxID=104421 RepID=E2A1C1_CAMFO|nr:group XIIA secretory phospholipase A2 [Camponotus floridanus]EFN72747.1 Group XIIA secretory phospholipase A2 [Camponotus floridanus]
MDLQYRKVIIYAITFLAYAWSGYGAGLLSNLRDAVLAAESVFQDLFSNAITVARKIKDIHEVFDAAVEENCVFQCPDGFAPKPDWNHKPRSDGCGSLGIKVNQEYLPLSEMTKCCDFHDICYDTCNTDKEKCDLEFKRCLYKFCDTYETTGVTVVNTCKAAAKVLFTGTTALGCKSFLDAQKEACYCRSDKWSKNKKPKKSAQAGGEL